MLMNESVNLWWITNSNKRIDHLAFGLANQHIWATSLQMGTSSFVIELGCAKLVAFVKKTMWKFASQFITKLQGQFSTNNLMDEFCIMYSQYGYNQNCKQGFVVQFGSSNSLKVKAWWIMGSKFIFNHYFWPTRIFIFQYHEEKF